MNVGNTVYTCGTNREFIIINTYIDVFKKRIALLFWIDKSGKGYTGSIPWTSLGTVRGEKL